jgi:cob(I)alamin adenosyltransferase
MEETKIDWDLMQLYMRVLQLKSSFEKSKREYEEYIIKCEKSIEECNEMLKDLEEFRDNDRQE